MVVNAANKAYALDQFLQLPPDRTPFHCHPLLPRNGMMLIYAPTKYLKSFLSLNVAYQFAEGSDVFGTWPVKGGGKKVLVIEQECGRDEAQSRAGKLHAARCGRFAGDNLYIVSKDLDCAIDTASGMALIESHIAESQAEIVVLDPWSWFHSVPENDNTEIKKQVRKLLKWQQEHNIATIVTHHTAKRGEFRAGNGTDIDSIKGGTALAEACSSVVGLSRPTSDPTLLRLDFTLRHAANPHPVKLQFDGTSGSFSVVK